MELVAQSPKPLGPSEIARDWTARGHKVSRQYVDKLMRVGVRGEKLSGDHVLSLDAAWLWRTQRTQFSKIHTGGAGQSTPPSGGGAPGQLSPGASSSSGAGSSGHSSDADADDSLEGELMRVRSLVFQASQAWAAAVKAKPYDGFVAARARKEYQEAVNTRIEVEGLIADYRKSLGLLVDLVDAQRLLDQRLAPIRSALHNLDKELAKELFPEDPARHRPRIRRVIARSIVATQAIARAKKRLHFPASGHVGTRAA